MEENLTPSEKPAADAEPAKTPAGPGAATADQPQPVRAPIFAIVIAVLVSAVLIGLTVLAYVGSKEDKESTGSESTTTQTPASESDIQDTSDDVDTTLDELDDDTDFNENDVSDSTLSL